MLIIDTGSTVDGYYCDFDRNFAFGPPTTSAAARTISFMRPLMRASRRRGRAGQRATSGARWPTRLGEDAVRGASVGRMGHGLGLALTEPPSIHPDDQTVLEPGMVITIEPGIAYEAAGGARKVMVHEENILVTEAAPELLSVRAVPAMPIVS